MTRIKLCGLTREDDIRAANDLLPEYVGFVFWEKSRRYAAPEQAKSLRKILDDRITAVGVFVDEEPGKIASLVNAGIISAIQLHGRENEAYIAHLRTLSAAPIIKAFTPANLRETSADYVMIDSGMGTGKIFDWTKINLTRPFFLAGGLNPDNVRTAIRTLHPFAVDVSSGIETEGVKDCGKMRAFVEAARQEDKL